MISNQILQSTIDGLKVISRIDLSVMDLEGNVLAATYPEAEEHHASVLSFVDSPADSQVVQGYQFFKIFDESQLDTSWWQREAAMRFTWIGKDGCFSDPDPSGGV